MIINVIEESQDYIKELFFIPESQPFLSLCQSMDTIFIQTYSFNVHNPSVVYFCLHRLKLQVAHVHFPQSMNL